MAFIFNKDEKTYIPKNCFRIFLLLVESKRLVCISVYVLYTQDHTRISWVKMSLR